MTTQKNYTFEHFYNMLEVDEYVDYLRDEYPNMVQVETIGKSWEGRHIRSVKISKHGQVDGKRPIIFVDGGIHAREWAAHMSALYLLHHLVENSADHDAILDKVDWVIVPVVNPDGYEYSQSTVSVTFGYAGSSAVQLHFLRYLLVSDCRIVCGERIVELTIILFVRALI